MYDKDVIKYAKQLKIPYFRGVFMRDTLPSTGPWHRECAVLNLDTANHAGTHWVAYIKNDKKALYFDSYGNLKPPRELAQYLGASTKILYNDNQYQNFNQSNCGHLCLEFLFNETK